MVTTSPTGNTPAAPLDGWLGAPCKGMAASRGRRHSIGRYATSSPPDSLDSDLMQPAGRPGLTRAEIEPASQRGGSRVPATSASGLWW